MATIAEHLKAKDTPVLIDWAEMADVLQKESAPTVYVRVTMAPAPTVLNLWASQVWFNTGGGKGYPDFADVLCSDSAIDADTKEQIPDPGLKDHLAASRKLAWEASRTYQASPGKYERHVKDGLVKPVYLSATAIVESVIQACRAPEWFVQWLFWRWPDTGKYSHDRGDDRGLVEQWVDATKAVPVMGHLCADMHGKRAASAVVRKADSEFMDRLRAVVSPLANEFGKRGDLPQGR